MSDPAFPWPFAYAARRLHVKRRTLNELCKKIESDHPGIRIRRFVGRECILTQSDWEMLLESLPCSKSSNDPEARTCTSAAPSEASLSMKAQRLLNEGSPRKSGSKGKRKSLTVLSMERRRRQHS